MEDLEPFIEWMRSRGTSEQHLEAHRHYAMELAKHPSLSAALRAEEEAGSAPKRIANIRQVAARIAEFQSGGSTVDATPVAVEPQPAPPAQSAAPPRSIEARRRGCECRERHDISIDNDFGAAASMLGGGVGIGTIVLIRFVGVIGALAIALGLAGLGGFITVISICFRCDGCRCTVRDLDADERADLRRGRALVAVVTLGLLAGAAICGFIWWSAVNAMNERDYEYEPSELQQPAESEPEPEPGP